MYKKISLFIIVVSIIQFNYVNAADDRNNERIDNRFSFGFDYSPLNVTSWYMVYDNPYYDEAIILKGTASVETNFTVYLFPQLRLVSSIIYDKSYTSQKYERHDVDEDNTHDFGYERIDDLNTLYINIGGKYYLRQPETKKLNAFLTFGIGKQFASVIDKDKQLFVEYDPDDPQIEDNREEYIEQINSPRFAFIGLGPEYFFNDVLSIYFYYRYELKKIYGKRKYIETGVDYYDNEYTDTKTWVYNELKVQNRISIGLNFYL